MDAITAAAQFYQSQEITIMLNMKKVDTVVSVRLVDLVSLGHKLEEMRACNEGMGSHCIDLLLDIQKSVIPLLVGRLRQTSLAQLEAAIEHATADKGETNG